MDKQEPQLVTFTPKLFIYRDGRATSGACWGVEIGDYPDKDSFAAFASTIPEALKVLAEKLSTLDSPQLERALGGVIFI